MTLIIGIAGLRASGKTSLACNLENIYNKQKNGGGLDVFRMATSDILIEWAEKHGITTDKKALQGIYEVLAKERGKEVLSKLMLRKLDVRQEDVFIIEGLRKQSDILYLERFSKTRGGTLVLIYLYAIYGTRFRRFNQLLETTGKRKIDIEDFHELEGHLCERDHARVSKAVIGRGGLYLNTTNLNEESVLRRVLEHVADIGEHEQGAG
jgi:cytidylate kinase